MDEGIRILGMKLVGIILIGIAYLSFPDFDWRHVLLLVAQLVVGFI